jgi:hypothetical protein
MMQEPNVHVKLVSYINCRKVVKTFRTVIEEAADLCFKSFEVSLSNKFRDIQAGDIARTSIGCKVTRNTSCSPVRRLHGVSLLAVSRNERAFDL